MVRQQLLLRPDQRRRLERLALAEGRSLSDVARQALDRGMDHLEGRTDEQVQQALEALDDLRRLRERTRARCGTVDQDLLTEAREEREEDRERIWRGQ